LATAGRVTSPLIEVDGGDQNGADSNLLPEGLDADDNEPVLENGGNEEAYDGAEHRADTAKEAGSADHDCGDHVQVGLRLAAIAVVPYCDRDSMPASPASAPDIA